MILKLFILFTTVPLIELAILIKVGSHIGTMETIGIVLGTALLGAILIKLQGLLVLDSVTEALMEKRFPTEELMSAFLVVVSGILLVTPGILTDILSIFLLTPPGNSIVIDLIKKKFREKINKGKVTTITIDKP